MNKITFLSLLALFALPLCFSSIAKEQDNDCESVVAKLNAAKSEYEANYKEQKKAYGNWVKYHKELHSASYGLTDEPLSDSYKKCKSGEIDKKDFCKGVIKKYDEITAKEEPAKTAYAEAESKAEQSRGQYNDLVAQANELGCNPKKK